MLPDPTARLRFRPLRLDDAPLLGEALEGRDPVAWIEWQHRNYAEHGYGLWALETEDGELVGDCGLTEQWIDDVPHVEVGYHVRPHLRRRGYAAEAAAGVRDAARSGGVSHLVAIIRPDNLASQGVARAIGLTREREAHVHGGPALVFGVRWD